jgi:lipoprotein-anchoring transpeptidase ErfK/SrfK
MTVAENGISLHTWQISSARYGYRTPAGTFRPTWMTKMWYSRQYDLAPMPHAIFFHKGVAIHGTYATRALGNPASHGCVRLALANAATLFKLVSRHGKERTEIVVHGTPDHSTAGRVASYGGRASEEVVRFRRASSYRYLPPRYYGRGHAAYGYVAPRRAYAAPRHAPRGLYNGYSYGYGF